MLADARSRALVTNFAAQWLRLRNLDSITPDMRLFPDFDDNLRQAFRQETELFFDSILREDRSVLDLLRANYTFVNERLAKHYGIPNVYGSRFRRVTLDADSERGGLLRQGSILTVTSYATRTSPVLRGKWVLDNLLGVPPPPPPAGRAGAEGQHRGRQASSVRERLAEHRAQPGLRRLPQPDGSGRLLAREVTTRSAAGATVEAGDADRRVRRAARRQQVRGRRRARSGAAAPAGAVRRHVHRKAADLRARAAASSTTTRRRSARSCATRRPQDYRFSSIILGIVKSTPFQMRKSR